MTSPPPADVVCLGESMVTFLPSRPGPLADVPAFQRAIGGAESNVACALAGAGHRARWVSRVGADGFGDHLLRTITAAGVDTGAVERDPDRPTGVYFRTDGERATSLGGPGEGAGGPASTAEVVYYRAGSAASAMAPDTVDLAAARSGRVLHLTGITAALSAGCLALSRTLTAPYEGRPLVSFDVNYRVALWRPPADPRVLLELARGCDLVFVGEDEAEAAWGVTGGADAVRDALPEPATLVVKHGAAGATAYVRGGGDGSGDGAYGDGGDDAPYGDDRRVRVPAPRVDVVAPVGAGDAFAAGYLSAALRGLPLRDRLRHGHLLAAAALTVPGDLAEPPARADVDRLAALDHEAWGTLRLAPGWTTEKATAP
ncbi:sugar kinase [Streptomyces phytohabitans]|uniref:sugar kinase n=1 Tax=Streptomyces phytohabitans TaxID=1150371 RepID=UPI00345BCA30